MMQQITYFVFVIQALLLEMLKSESYMQQAGMNEDITLTV